MSRFLLVLLAAGLVALIGCSEAPKPAAKVEPAQVPPKPILFKQITVTDEHGTRTETVPVTPQAADYPGTFIPVAPKKMPPGGGYGAPTPTPPVPEKLLSPPRGGGGYR